MHSNVTSRWTALVTSYAASTLFNECFGRYGILEVIVSDQGTHFRNQLMHNLQFLLGYNHIFSTAYHPQSNGIVERFNATFVPQTAKLQDTESNNWDAYLPAVVFAYNTDLHRTTQFSPHELDFGRSPTHPSPASSTTTSAALIRNTNSAIAANSNSSSPRRRSSSPSSNLSFFPCFLHM